MYKMCHNFHLSFVPNVLNSANKYCISVFFVIIFINYTSSTPRVNKALSRFQINMFGDV